jgi:putative cell wall-binding protein
MISIISPVINISFKFNLRAYFNLKTNNPLIAGVITLINNNIMATTHAQSSKSDKKWSAHVTETSDALDLKKNVFELHNPKEIAKSLKNSAEKSDRKKSSPYRSAMSMLTFYINRAGKNLPHTQKEILEKAKDELRKEFGRA